MFRLRHIIVDLILIAFLCGTIQFLSTIDFSPAKSKPIFDTPALTADINAQIRLFEQNPLPVWDLSSIGSRTSSLSRILQAMLSDSSVDGEPFLRHLNIQFSDWNFSKIQYLPWSDSLKRTDIEPTGIVIYVRDEDTLIAGHLITILRNILNSTLSIEIAFSGDSDLPVASQQGLMSIDPTVRMRNLLDYFNESVTALGDDISSLRPFALLASGFRKAILMDPDVVFLQNPEYFFLAHPSLILTGSLFFHDRAYPRKGKFSRRDWVSKLLGENPPSKTLRETSFW